MDRNSLNKCGGAAVIKHTWWKYGVVYQVYPRSFQDTNADGIGDLPGIEKRLGYLKWLGVDAIWVSPIYPSPMADFGYDISEYCNVDPLFGSLDDFDRLMTSAYSLGLKVILDFVPNHTSDRHSWFLESRASRNNAKRDWYIWRDAKASGQPPNNWISQFGGPAWTFDPTTRQYYLHSFLSKQPDLNWRNPVVRAAMFDVMRFWLDRGVDGFRVDVLWLLIKDASLRDNPPNPSYQPTQAAINKFLPVYNADQPEIHDLIGEMRAVLDHYEDRVLIGEIYLPLERLVAYYGKELAGVHLPFNFQLLSTAWSANAIAQLVRKYEAALPADGWPNWVLGNHDQPRISARVGPAQARIAAILLLTLRGTPTLYYGDELGIGKVDIPRDAMQDPWEKNEPGLGLSRDPSRTPFHWDFTPYAGFSTVSPWLPLDPNYRSCNVEALAADKTSILNFYRLLLSTRRKHAALHRGTVELIDAYDDTLIYRRSAEQERILVCLNFSHTEQEIHRQDLSGAEVLACTHVDRTSVEPNLVLRPNEGLVILMPSSFDAQNSVRLSR
jgi:alpha-glucosidase